MIGPSVNGGYVYDIRSVANLRVPASSPYSGSAYMYQLGWSAEHEIDVLAGGVYTVGLFG